MHRQRRIAVLGVLSVLLMRPTFTCAENLAKEVKRAVDRSTLDQPGTKSFHLKAVVAPSFERDSQSGRTGEVEIWWVSPTQWKRDVRSADFHQIEFVDGGHDWQKNEGEYFPQWLQQTAVELISPIPPVEEEIEQANGAATKR